MIALLVDLAHALRRIVGNVLQPRDGANSEICSMSTTSCRKCTIRRHHHTGTCGSLSLVHHWDGPNLFQFPRIWRRRQKPSIPLAQTHAQRRKVAGCKSDMGNPPLRMGCVHAHIGTRADAHDAQPGTGLCAEWGSMCCIWWCGARARRPSRCRNPEPEVTHMVCAHRYRSSNPGSAPQKKLCRQKKMS